jgi:hypothetical protein
MTQRIIIESRLNDIDLQLVEKEGGTPEIFSEGVHGIAILGGHVKFILFSACPWTSKKQETEVRQAVATVVMPLSHFCDVAALLYKKVDDLKKAGLIIETVEESKRDEE